MPRFRQTVPVDDYVLDVLMRDLVGHDRQPAAFLVFLFLYGRAAREGWRPVAASLRMIADETGLSKSAVQAAVVALQRNELIATRRRYRTAVPGHRVLRHWQETPAGVLQRGSGARAGGRSDGKRKAFSKTSVSRPG